MTRVVAPDGACVQLEVGGRQYIRGRDGCFDIPDHHVGTALKAGECFLPTVRVGGRGYRCGRCGFLAVFKKQCGRCGSTELNPEE